MTREHEELMSITDQAAYWSVVFRDGEPSAAEKREFVDWVALAPEHVEASLHVARARAAISREKLRWPDTLVEDLIREAKETSGENVFQLHPRPFRRVEPRPRRALPLALGVAASLLIAVCFAWYGRLRPAEFQTSLGEQRSIRLADGSRVTLNTNSRIEVRLRGNHRIVDLVRGEALFEVAHDASRPFDVRTGGVAVRAVGTQFDVDRRANHTAVTVVEGRVAVVSGSSGTQASPLLVEADRVVIDAEGVGPVQHGVNVNDVTAWTQQQLIFRRRPLGEVAEEFNRYNGTRVELRSPTLRNQEVTGTFRSDQVASFLNLLGGMPGVHVSTAETGAYVVTYDEAAASRPADRK